MTFRLKPRTGRPPMTTKREDWIIVKMSLKDHINAAMSISCAFHEQTGKPISRKTVSCRLNKEKLVARFPCHKPLDFKEKLKGLSWLHHRAYPVDSGTMEYGSL